MPSHNPWPAAAGIQVFGTVGPMAGNAADLELLLSRDEEPTLIAIAAQLEKALGGWLDPDAP
jgi:hypothetical protein